MRTKDVVVNGNYYRLTALPCDKAGAISIELMSDVAPLIVAFFDGNTELLNKEIRQSINNERIMRMLTELINPMILLKNNELVKDWKEEFQCKPMTLMQLGYEALRFNCEDFFTFISGFLKEKTGGINLNERIKSLRNEGVEIPPIFSLLMENGEDETEVNNSVQK